MFKLKSITNRMKKTRIITFGFNGHKDFKVGPEKLANVASQELEMLFAYIKDGTVSQQGVFLQVVYHERSNLKLIKAVIDKYHGFEV